MASKTKAAAKTNSIVPLARLLGTLVLVGAGKMGGAMLDGWLARKLPARQVIVLDPKPPASIKRLARKGVRINPKGVLGEAAVVVIAVKPQIAPDALPALVPLIGKGTLVISIMAGRPLSFLEGALPKCAMVRAMPNTPASIGRGITVAVGNSRVKPASRALAHALLTATGAVEWIRDEALMDAVTAVSGSGPAYVFLLAETLAQAGIAAGLPPKLAETLARATVAGSGELLHRSAEPSGVLRQNVTSPGGTTAAALAVLMGPGGLSPLLEAAVDAATRRGRELAG